jgi:hypothetical protein
MTKPGIDYKTHILIGVRANGANDRDLPLSVPATPDRGAAVNRKDKGAIPHVHSMYTDLHPPGEWRGPTGRRAELELGDPERMHPRSRFTHTDRRSAVSFPGREAGRLGRSRSQSTLPLHRH